MGKKAQKIIKEMAIAEVMDKYPKTVPILMGFGFHCVGCPMSQSETIEDLAKNSQIDLKKLLASLNGVTK